MRRSEKENVVVVSKAFSSRAERGDIIKREGRRTLIESMGNMTACSEMPAFRGREHAEEKQQGREDPFSAREASNQPRMGQRRSLLPLVIGRPTMAPASMLMPRPADMGRAS
jgi:hypothetical protein